MAEFDILALLTAADQTDARRNMVLDAALEGLLEAGVMGTTVAAISRRSGVSRATLYRWYAAKNDILVAGITREFRRVLVALDREIDRRAPGHEQVTGLLVRAVRRIATDHLLQYLLRKEPEIVYPILVKDAERYLEVFVTYLALHLKRLRAEGRIAPVEPTDIAEVLGRFVHSMVMTLSTSDDRQQSDERIPVLTRSLVRGLLLREPVETAGS